MLQSVITWSNDQTEDRTFIQQSSNDSPFPDMSPLRCFMLLSRSLSQLLLPNSSGNFTSAKLSKYYRLYYQAGPVTVQAQEYRRSISAVCEKTANEEPASFPCFFFLFRFVFFKLVQLQIILVEFCVTTLLCASGSRVFLARVRCFASWGFSATKGKVY